MLIPSPCVNTTPEPFNLKVHRSRLFQFFRRFPQINVGGDSARIPFVENPSRESRVALPPKGRLRQEGEAKALADQGEWASFIEVFALLIFGVVLFPNMEGLVDLVAIDAFLAYHHSKESLVIAILADVYDMFD